LREVPVQAAVEPMKYAPAENVCRTKIREEILEIPAAAEMSIPVFVRGAFTQSTPCPEFYCITG
jgi:hypothetical protein